MALELKVFSLNCWGLPFPVICKNRKERIQAIGDYLAHQDYDFVVLQEIWVKSDFQKLKERLSGNLLHSHYFYSGAIGSGVCIFSKHPIVETNFHLFPLNGHAHKIFHGDWFGGKGIGLAKAQVDDLDIYLYCTHFHAEYNPGNDEYRAHRITQSFELGQYIKSTMEGSDLVIVAGDLNTPPSRLGYKVITLNPELKDCWLEKKNKVECEFGGTCALPTNCYTTPEERKMTPKGERIDYIMYRARKGLDVDVASCTVGLGNIPDSSISYSDHEAVMARLKITKTSTSSDTDFAGFSKELKDTLQESLLMLDKGISQCLSEEKFFKLVVFLMCFGLYILGYQLDESVTGNGAYITAIVGFTKLIVAITLGFCVWTALILKRSEFYSLVGAKDDVARLLQYGGRQSRSF